MQWTASFSACNLPRYIICKHDTWLSSRRAINDIDIICKQRHQRSGIQGHVSNNLRCALWLGSRLFTTESARYHLQTDLPSSSHRAGTCSGSGRVPLAGRGSLPASTKGYMSTWIVHTPTRHARRFASMTSLHHQQNARSNMHEQSSQPGEAVVEVRILDSHDNVTSTRAVRRSFPKAKPQKLVTELERLLKHPSLAKAFEAETTTTSDNAASARLWESTGSTKTSHQWTLLTTDDALSHTYIFPYSKINISSNDHTNTDSKNKNNITKGDLLTEFKSRLSTAETQLNHHAHVKTEIHPSLGVQVVVTVCTTHQPPGLSMKDIRLADHINEIIDQINNDLNLNLNPDDNISDKIHDKITSLSLLSSSHEPKTTSSTPILNDVEQSLSATSHRLLQQIIQEAQDQKHCPTGVCRM